MSEWHYHCPGTHLGTLKCDGCDWELAESEDVWANVCICGYDE